MTRSRVVVYSLARWNAHSVRVQRARSARSTPNEYATPRVAGLTFWHFVETLTPHTMNLVCLDLEGVLVPEIWISVAEKTGRPELRRTTRDEPDYDKLMRYRLELLDRHGITLPMIQEVIGGLRPLDGALEFVENRAHSE